MCALGKNAEKTFAVNGNSKAVKFFSFYWNFCAS